MSAHIAEVDARRLYAREGWPSMFQYCLGVLHLSESEAYRRIAAARLSCRYPVILEMLENGRLHLAGIAGLSKHLTNANYEEVLARATHKTKREIEILAAELAPKPDVPPKIRKLPARKTKLVAPPLPTIADVELCPGRVDTPRTPPATPKTSVMEPLAPARYKVQFTASAELHDKIERLVALTPESDLAAVIDTAITEKLERVEAKRFGKTKRPRRTVEQTDTSPGSRDIPAPVKRTVWERDGGQCTFVSNSGKRCPERVRLEFHHDEPYALGGDRSPENIRILCHQHNTYMAELDYGKDVMDRYRRFSDCVREPRPAFELCLDRVVTAMGP